MSATRRVALRRGAERAALLTASSRLAPALVSALGACEHAFVTSQGHLASQYARACAKGNYLIAAGLAAQMRPLALGEALLLLPLIADHAPAKFDAAAVRWHARWQLEGREVDLESSALALAALASLRGSRREDGLRVLRCLV
jgi:hypothetical protein